MIISNLRKQQSGFKQRPELARLTEMVKLQSAIAHLFAPLGPDSDIAIFPDLINYVNRFNHK